MSTTDVIKDRDAFILCNDYNLFIFENTKYEPFFIEDDVFVFRLCHKQSATNVLVKFNADQLVH